MIDYALLQRAQPYLMYAKFVNDTTMEWAGISKEGSIEKITLSLPDGQGSSGMGHQESPYVYMHLMYRIQARGFYPCTHLCEDGTYSGVTLFDQSFIAASQGCLSHTEAILKMFCDVEEGIEQKSRSKVE